MTVQERFGANRLRKGVGYGLLRKLPLSEGVYIELRDGKRLIAEGIDALLEYGDTRVTVGAGAQHIVFEGDGLEMTYLSENRIVLEGTIRTVRYEV